MNKNYNQLYQEKRTLQALVALLTLLLVGLILFFIGLYLQNISNFWSNALRELGMVFAPAAILGLLYEYFAERDHAREVATQITEYLEDQLEHRLGGLLEKSDVVAIYPARHAIDFHKFFNQAESQLDILTTNLQSMEIYVGLLIDLASRGIKVRILTMSPSNDFIKGRFPDLGFTKAKSFSEEMIVSLRHFCRAKETRLAEEQKGNFEVKIYKNTPTIMLFRRDDNIIIGFILQQGRARDQLHIEFKIPRKQNREYHSKAFEKHYELLWNRSETISTQEAEQMEPIFPEGDQN